MHPRPAPPPRAGPRLRLLERAAARRTDRGQPAQHAQGQPGRHGRSVAARAAAGPRRRRPQPASRIAGNKSVILLWMTGGPSHIDTWDVKPDAPRKSAARSARSRTEAARRADLRVPAEAGGDDGPAHDHPLGRCAVTAITSRTRCSRPATSRPRRASIARGTSTRRSPRSSPSIAARPNPAMPPYVVLNMQVALARGLGRLPGQAVRSVPGQPGRRRCSQLPRRLGPATASHGARRSSQQFDRLRRDLDLSGSMAAMDRFEQQASTSSPDARRKRPSTCRASRRQCASATASTTGASRRCSPGGWSRRASAS